jgi:hypothetical protein
MQQNVNGLGCLPLLTNSLHVAAESLDWNTLTFLSSLPVTRRYKDLICINIDKNTYPLYAMDLPIQKVFQEYQYHSFIPTKFFLSRPVIPVHALGGSGPNLEMGSNQASYCLKRVQAFAPSRSLWLAATVNMCRLSTAEIEQPAAP